ncbi:MAG: MBL fold metallo-hydrolase [Deltaproteobacteria bacterium]|nr:MBL fold metallo-hydrolase [Deltaproteobacteria bacterium]
MAQYTVNEVDKVEILTLQDNYIEITAGDNSEIIHRAAAVKEGSIRQSILAEHGYCAVVKTTTGDRLGTLLFDFGFSEDGAAANAKSLGLNMKEVVAAALSHGHSDHTGGVGKLGAMIGKKEVPLALHPAAFKSPRYIKVSDQLKIYFPKLAREDLEKAGFKVVESKTPLPLLDGDILFLGEIPRRTDFEKGMAVAHFLDNGKEKWDPLEDDTSIVMNLKRKGLVVLSGCAHAGIVNTVRQAIEVTGIDQIHVVMGGFHLSGPAFEPIIGRTTEELKKFNPAYIVPTHCTGRKAVMHMEKEMPRQFLLNMSGTTLTFTGSS